MIALFWILAFLVVFSLAGYGILWILMARLVPAKDPGPVQPVRATMLIAARNEADSIAEKIEAVLDQDCEPHDLSILVVSDGSDDGTETEVERVAAKSDRVHLLVQPDHKGKAAALNLGLSKISSDQIVVFSDANSLLKPGSLSALLRPFSADWVGGTIGQLDISKKGGFLAFADRLFWKYDNALKAAEDRIGGTISAQGTLYALRRELIGDVPEAMADDLANSLGVVARGRRLFFVPDAVAVEKVTDKTKSEFGRRVRSTERGWRGLMHYAGLMNPFRHGAYAFQLFFHKCLRRLVAFILPMLFVVTWLLAGSSWFFAALAIIQTLFYGLGIGAVYVSALARVPGASLASLFTVGHIAMAMGVLRALLGKRSVKWSPVRTTEAN